jgi:DNA polymerase/3'-5' exonuclease PolX
MIIFAIVWRIQAMLITKAVVVYSMYMKFSNAQVATQLREVAAALKIKKKDLFRIKAYETAADGIEHLTADAYDLWQEDRLGDIPGVGSSLTEHLQELFKNGKVSHWDEIKKGIPSQTFQFLDIPGIGPKTALELAELGIKDTDDLQNKITSGELVEKGFCCFIF